MVTRGLLKIIHKSTINWTINHLDLTCDETMPPLDDGDNINLVWILSYHITYGMIL
jgi:hypothetical protein